MKFGWVACEPNCRGWVSAVGVVTADSPRDFEDFARGRDLAGATVVLDSSGGSVNDSIALGRRFRDLGMLTTVGVSVLNRGTQGERGSVSPEAYCELMCVFLLLSGKTRYVPEQAHVRVHQIWMGDRADDARAATYTAQDMTIVERDIGRLAKYTFDMGGAGDLLSLSLSVAPWEELHELTPAELRLTNLVTTAKVAEVLPRADVSVPMAGLCAEIRTGAFSEQRERDGRTGREGDQDCGSRGSDRRCRDAREVTADQPCAAAGCLDVSLFPASIWPIASTTASKVSMVEAWRAL